MEYEQKKQRILERLKMANAPMPDAETLEKMIAAEPSSPAPIAPSPEPTAQERIEKNLEIRKKTQVPSAFGPALSDDEMKQAYKQPSVSSMAMPAAVESGSSPQPATASRPDPKAPDVSPEQGKIRDVGSSVLASASEGDQNAPMDVRTSAEIIRAMDRLAKDKELQRGAPPETRQSLDAALAEAKRMFQEKSTKLEWLEVAQMLGQSVAQFAAARSGGSKTDMSNLKFGALDYGKKVDRARDEYTDSIKQAHGVADDERTLWKDRSDERKEEYNKQEDVLGNELNVAMQRERDRNSNRAQSDQERKLEIAELNRQEELAKKKLTLYNNIAQEDDLSSKSFKKLQERYGSDAGKAEIDFNALQNELSSTDKDGTLWGKNPDPEARKGKVDEKVAEVKSLLSSIEQRKRDLGVNKLPQAGNRPQSPQAPQSSSTKTVKVKGPSGQIAEMTEEASKKYLSKPGYSLVN
jgi:hypothetical protein